MASRESEGPVGGDGRARRAGGGGGFALLSNAFLDELRARTLLSALIGRTLKLHKAGPEYKACCPFHHEKTPSFYVNDSKQFYHCFGCGAHGDAIRWMTDQRGLPFMDAVKELADAAGMALPAPDPASRERAERAAGLQDVTAAAAAFYAQRLAAPAGAEARAYLARRGLDAATIAEFGLGYAPAGRRALAEALTRFPEAMLVESGMLIRPESGETYDRFRERLIIPIADRRGRVIAFGGRILGTGEPKYLNSPETPLFDKGATLFNLHRAAAASRKSGRLIVVEGYLDVIALAQAGIGEAVAPLGTALTERQLEAAWALADAPILCMDGDAAGRKAAVRAAERAMPLLRPGKSLAFVTLPAGIDPDDLVRSGGAAAMEAALAQPLPLLRLIYEHERAAGDMAQPEQRAGLRRRLEALAASCTDPIVAQEFKRSFNDLFFEDFGWKRGERRAIASAVLHSEPRQPGDVGGLVLRQLLYGLSRHPQVLRRHAERLAHLPIDQPRLARWRDTLVAAALRGADLEGDCIDHILAADGLAQVLEQRLTRDLRFAFTSEAADEERRIAVLEGLIAFLCEERELDEGLRGLDRAAVEDGAGDGYLAIEAERQYLRARRAELFAAASFLGSGGQD
ncbi:DNA primase [Sphingomonas morindae]|uniref:DNA primase n=1 Tax=Sphingomonas morindae TaxID=1541170 RepID=A0ABY4X7Z4_9SPHN|nr:DNA primase [Sphingomonas morindae]USI73042.1 DNA primase [Sphingomonas morindae]